MPKKNNPGCQCCLPPCLTTCADGSTDEIAEWEWSIADLSDNVTLWVQVATYIGGPLTWYKVNIQGYPQPWNFGLAELNGIYIHTHDLVNCQTPTLTDSTLISVSIYNAGTGTCPVDDPYAGGFSTIWRATAISTYMSWWIYLDGLSDWTGSLFDYVRARINQLWSAPMFDVRPGLGGDGLCVSKTYQYTMPWPPGGCTVSGSPQTINNVYTVTPA